MIPDKTLRHTKNRTKTIPAMILWFISLLTITFSAITARSFAAEELASEVTSISSQSSLITIFAPPIIKNITETGFTVKLPTGTNLKGTQKFQVKINSKALYSETPDRQFNISDLASGTVYRVEYQVIDGEQIVGKSSATDTITIPDAPYFVSSGEVTDNAVDLYWSEMPGAYGYHIFKNHNTLISTHPASETSTTIKDLTPGEALNLQIAAFNDSGVSVFSESSEIKVPAINLEVSEFTQTSATLSWSRVESAISYGIIISDSFNSKAFIGPLDTDTTSYTIASGTPGEHFSVQIVASLTIDDQVISKEVRSQLIPETPLEPWIKKSGPEKYLLKWFPVLGADYYRVFLDGINPVGQVSAPSTEILIELPANSDREIKLSIISGNKSGESPPSPELKIRLNYDELKIADEESIETNLASSSKELTSLRIGETIPNFSLTDDSGNDFNFYLNTSKCQLFMFLSTGDTAKEQANRHEAKALVISAGMEGLPVIHVKAPDEKAIINSGEYPSNYYFNSLNDKEDLVANKIFQVIHRPTIVLVDKNRKVIGIDTVSDHESMIPRIMEKVSKLGYCNTMQCVQRYKLITNFKKLHKER